LVIVFHIPGALREYTSGQSKVSIDSKPNTLQEALTALWRVHPGLKDRIVTEQGQLREHINIFIGDENIRYTGGLMSSVHADAEISIVPAISGGV
jgi:molybdopterin converting factor small subunit